MAATSSIFLAHHFATVRVMRVVATYTTTQEDAQPANEEAAAADDFDVDMVDAEEENFEGEGVESVDAEEDDFQEVHILDEDWLIPDNN